MMKLHRILPALAVAVAGCVAVDEEIRSEHEGLLSVLAAEDDQSVEAEEPHVGAWTPEELALRAGLRSQEMKEGALDAMIARLKADKDTAWRDPEFRYGGSWGDGDASGDSWTIGDRLGDSDSKDSSRQSHKFSARFFIPNPFINRYLSDKGDAEVRRCEARAESKAFAIYSEVKLLCNEERRLGREFTFLSDRLKALETAHDIAVSEATNHVARSPYELIRAESKFRQNQVSVAEVEFRLRQIRSTIAMLADVPLEGFEIAAPTSDVLTDEMLSEDRLTELAFARRPDLARAVAEYDAAVAEAGAARAANIPWFRYVEAGYRFIDADKSGTSSRYDGYKYSRATDSGHDFSVKVAITVPLFTWCGNSVKLTNRMRELADDRVRSLRASIRREVANAVAVYRLAESSVNIEDGAFVKEMFDRIEGAAEENAETAESCKAKIELLDYTRFINDAVAARREALLNLETVIGGPVR